MGKIRCENIIIIICVAVFGFVAGSYFTRFETVEITIDDTMDKEIIEDDGCVGAVSGNEITDDGKININTADKDVLATLDGIGGKMAERIIEYRNNQRFETIEDFMKVPGIGQKTFDKNKEKISVGQ